jgi:hypothetical protein
LEAPGTAARVINARSITTICCSSNIHAMESRLAPYCGGCLEIAGRGLRSLTMLGRCPLWVDAVEKRFCRSLQARLNQDQPRMRNIDSTSRSERVDHCAFLFHSDCAATFSTASVKTGKAQREAR